MLHYLLLSSLLIGHQSRSMDFSQLCLKVIKKFDQLRYPAKLVSGPSILQLESGEKIKVDSYFESGRTSLIGKLDSLGSSTEIIVKKVRHPKYNKNLEGELEFWNNNIRAFEGRVVPILMGAKAVDGTTVLFKPFVSGESLWKLVVQKKLDISQLNSLKTLLLWARTYKENVGTALDINPLNIVWVSVPSEMKALGLTEASFVFYELTPAGSKLDSFLYDKILARVRSYRSPKDLLPSDVEPLVHSKDESSKTLTF